METADTHPSLTMPPEDDDKILDQATSLVRHGDKTQWTLHLSETNSQREQLAERIINEVIPNTHNVDHIGRTIDAFMNANMMKHLMLLLDTLVFRGEDTRLQQQCNIQNLLLMTAIK